MRQNPVLSVAILIPLARAAWVSLDEGDLDVEAETVDASLVRHHAQESATQQQAEMERRSAKHFFDEYVGPSLDSESRKSVAFIFEPGHASLQYDSFLELKKAIEAHSQSAAPEPTDAQMRQMVKNPDQNGVLIKSLKAGYDFMKKSRGGVSLVMPVLSAFAPDNCVSHLIAFWYTLIYRFDEHDEDDYPYFPIHCGLGFSWETGTIRTGGLF
mmetsp:Transcript_66793/g.118240  ORF Transcript_66793/g.118240 Transcript_66793/m.118240 type:complete len:213 (+) Transcript_66793:116-754(+)